MKININKYPYTAFDICNYLRGYFFVHMGFDKDEPEVANSQCMLAVFDWRQELMENMVIVVRHCGLVVSAPAWDGRNRL